MVSTAWTKGDNCKLTTSKSDNCKSTTYTSKHAHEQPKYRIIKLCALCEPSLRETFFFILTYPKKARIPMKTDSCKLTTKMYFYKGKNNK
jgi:hypothetical protein